MLGAVKTEFGKFGTVIQKVQRKLQEASNAVDQAATRTRVMERKLRGVEGLAAPQAEQLLVGALGGGAVPAEHAPSTSRPDHHD